MNSKQGINVDMVTRLEYTDDKIHWADAVFTAGGDGTFLLAASKVKGHDKPVVGINTDPIRYRFEKDLKEQKKTKHPIYIVSCNIFY